MNFWLFWTLCSTCGLSFKCLNSTPVTTRLYATVVRPAMSRLSRVDDGKDRCGSYAIVHISGVPRWVERGRFYDVYRIQQSPGSNIHLLRVAFFQSPEGWYVHGEPYLENIRVIATVQKHFKSPKMYTLKFRSKKHYKRKYGHRQEMTRILIKDFEYLEHGQDWRSIDPLYFVLERIRLSRHPSLHLPKFKRDFLARTTRQDKMLLGPDPLQDLDPIFNREVIKQHVSNL